MGHSDDFDPAPRGYRVFAFAVTSPIHAAMTKPGRQVVLTPERMAELQKVNHHVNSTIVEVTDLEQYGREDVWALPTSGRGDCEDFAILKRKMLIERGWPASVLSVTVGATAQGVAHAVLTVSTAQGAASTRQPQPVHPSAFPNGTHL
ncbi:hypothetical protein DC522_27190 [Microvirga sp. KLBC 81]|nr:hypothetical protein DC522_27190 [Microvirga sp. KLBC 81]